MDLYNQLVLLVCAGFVLSSLFVFITDRFAMPRQVFRDSLPDRTLSSRLTDATARLIVVALIYLAFFAISWRPYYSTQATISFFVIFTGISRAKFAFIREPLVFSDIALVADVFKYKDIFYATRLNVLFWTVALSYVFGASGLYMWLEPTLLPEKGAVFWIVAIIGFALAPWLLLFNKAMNAWIYKVTSTLVRKPHVKKSTARFGTFTSVILHFILWLGLRRDEVVHQISAKVSAALHDLWLHSEHPTAPLIVVWQSESFIDLRHFGEDVPLPNLDRLRPKAVQWGRMTNVFEGGYTLRTEFAVLSGLLPENVHVDASFPYLRASHYKDVVWPQKLKRAGWLTHFIHPYEKTFFMRHKAMPELGFDEMMMLDDFDHDPKRDGTYVSDWTLTTAVMEKIERSPEKTFMFVASMANHGPWEPSRCPGLTDPVDIYSHLLQEADTALGRLTDHLETLDRPVWLLFYGDHAPLLKSFADPFPDPRTDYLIVPLGQARRAKHQSVAAQEEAPWNLLDRVLHFAGLKQEVKA